MNTKLTPKQLLLKRIGELYQSLGLIALYGVVVVLAQGEWLDPIFPNSPEFPPEGHGVLVLLMTLNAAAYVGRLHKCIHENLELNESKGMD